MAGAVTGIKIGETGSYVTRALASPPLADRGADVIKIEEPTRGDPFRGWGGKNYSATFCSLNRNKKSLTLDLRRDEARDVMRKLLSRSDVFIENFRPGTLAKRGLGYEDI